MKVKVMGGRSTVSQISILSSEFVATGIFHRRQNRITCRVKRHGPLSRFFYRHKNVPIPMLVRLVLFLMDCTPKWVLLLALLVAIGPLLATKYLQDDSAVPDWPIIVLLRQYSWIFFGVFLGFMTARIIHILRTASWHGAEHMAIAAYERTNSTNLEEMTKESPVHSQCGGVLILPLLAIAPITATLFIAGLFRRSEVIGAAVSFAILLECVLWVDHLYGWDRIPLTSHASRFLQKYITTRQPNERELRTAQKALQKLIAAHNSLS